MVAVPLAAHGDAEADHALGVRVVDNYAAGDPVHALHEPTPTATWPDDIADIVDARPARARRAGPGAVLHRPLRQRQVHARPRADDLILEQGERTVTSLDGDVVRRNLSAGLTFSKADRETNIRRIGWVAAEISPARRRRRSAARSRRSTRPASRSRQMVDEAGGAFFLVHVATPLEECERRDRKGLYAKARAGEIPEFTGISSPYEEPDDADVRVDTTGRTIEDALGDVARRAGRSAATST